MPKGNDVRPTADRVKESLFNILARQIEGAEVLDIFCGSGALGIECLSRGAKSVVFVDNSNKSVGLCKANLQMLGENATVNLSDYKSFLNRCGQRFDIIFLDPPYNKSIGEYALNLIARNKLLKKDKIAVLESEKEGGEICGLEKYDSRAYGNCHLTFYKFLGD